MLQYGMSAHTHTDWDETLHIKTSSHFCQMPLLPPEGRFDVTMKHTFTPISPESKGHRDRLAVARTQNEQLWVAVNASHVMSYSYHLVREDLGYYDAWLPVSVIPFYLSDVLPVAKINIWFSAAAEVLIFYNSGLFYIQEVTDTESLICFWSSCP